MAAERTVKLMGYAAEEVGLRVPRIAQSLPTGPQVVGVLQLDMTNYKPGIDMRLVTTIRARRCSSTCEPVRHLPWPWPCAHSPDVSTAAEARYPSAMMFEPGAGTPDWQLRHPANDRWHWATLQPSVAFAARAGFLGELADVHAVVGPVRQVEASVERCGRSAAGPPA